MNYIVTNYWDLAYSLTLRVTAHAHKIGSLIPILTPNDPDLRTILLHNCAIFGEDRLINAAARP